MSYINTSINTAVKAYQQKTQISRNAVSKDYDSKNKALNASSEEMENIWKAELERLRGKTQKRTVGARDESKKPQTSQSPQSCYNADNKRKYDGFDYYFTDNKAKAPKNPQNTDKAEFVYADSDEMKKAMELQEAYDYFRRAVHSNGYTIVKSSSDKFLSYAVQSGNKSVIMIDPEFMASIRDNPEALKKYADEIENMKKLDKQFAQRAKQQGKTVVSRGWRIEKDGSISSWSVVKTERKAGKGQLERLREYQEKLLKKKVKKKKEELRLENNRSKRREEKLRLEGKKNAANRENYKRKIKKARIIDLSRLYLRPKTNPNKKITSISVSCGSSPSLLNQKA